MEPERGAVHDSSAGQLGSLRAQWLLRMLDFLSTSMVIPTMAQFLSSAGGNAQDYFLILGITTAVQLASNMLVGICVDWTGQLLPCYICTTAFSIVGGVIYAAADAYAVLRTTRVILFARLLTGLGSGKATLVFVFLGRTAKAAERQAWVVRFSTARSLGLFVGPPLAVGLAEAAAWLRGVGSTSTDTGGSWLGTFAIPGLFLCFGNIFALIWLLARWQPLPPKPALAGKEGNAHAGGGQLRRFFSQARVVAVILGTMLTGGTVVGIEYVVPITVGRVLGWGVRGAGAVLMAIAGAVVTNQLVVLRLSSFMEDRQLLLLGASGMPATILATVGLWAMVLGRPGAGAWEACREHSLLLAVPFVIIECWCPHLGTSSSATFTRLVAEDAPSHMGFLQALVTSNGPVLGQMLCTAWLGVSYSEAIVVHEGAPLKCFLGIGLGNLVVFLFMWWAYPRLKARQDLTPITTPLVMWARSLSSFSDPAIMDTTEVLSFGGEPLLGDAGPKCRTRSLDLR